MSQKSLARFTAPSVLFDSKRVHQKRTQALSFLKAQPPHCPALKATNTLFQIVANHMIERLLPLKIFCRDILDASPLHMPPLASFLDTEERPICTQSAHITCLPDKAHQDVETFLAQANWQEKFHLILCPLQLHLMNDPLTILKQLTNYLKPGGLLVVNFWGGPTLQELRAIWAELDFESAGHITQRLTPMIPLQQAASLLKQTSLKLGVADEDTFSFYYSTLAELQTHWSMMGELGVLGQSPFATNSTLTNEAEKKYLQTYGIQEPHQKTLLPATLQLITLTGWKDGPSLPKPLQRGSATTSFAEALHTAEKARTLENASLDAKPSISSARKKP